MKAKITCPLGHECERIVDGELQVCAWYTQVHGTDPQTEEVINESKCAIAWLPILNVQQATTSINIAASIQSLRNETIKRQDAALGRLDGQISHNS